MLDGFLRRSGDALAYRGTRGDEAVHLLEYAPSGVTIRDAEGKLAALPVLDAAFAEGRDRFAALTRALATVDNPNIVGVSGGFAFGGTTWRIERVSGASLAERLASGSVADPDAFGALGAVARPDSGNEIEILARTITDIARGLQAAHAVGLVHLDISPETVVRGAGREQLSAFGVERRAYLRDAPERAALVRPGYAPLELDDPTGEEPVGAATDIHGLAALCWRLLTGETPPPWNRREPPPELPADLADVWSLAFLDAVVAGLAVEPEGRPRTIEAFLQPLKVALPPARNLPMRRIMEVAVAAGLCVIAFAGAYALVGGGRHSPGGGQTDVVAPVETVPAVFDPVARRTRDAAPANCLWSRKEDGAIALFCRAEGQSWRPVDARGLMRGDLEAADAGDTAALRRVTAFYLGEGMGRDADTAVALLRRAGSKGDIQAELDLAALLATGEAGVAKNVAGARSLYAGIIAALADQPSDGRAEAARQALLVLERDLWNGGWQADGDCAQMTLGQKAVSFGSMSGPLTDDPAPGRLEWSSEDGGVVARLNAAGDGMALLLDKSDKAVDYSRCQP